MSPPHPRRRDVLAGAAAMAAAPWWSARSPLSLSVSDDEPAGDGPRRPHVLFVLSDSHRAQSTGCYGDAQAVTPRFDAFAAQGLRLTTALANTPLCRPYRASLMSGLLGHANGMVTNTGPRNVAVDGRQWTPPSGPTLAQLFGGAGYRCAYVGKWHLGTVAIDPGPERLGFDDGWAVGSKPVHDYFRWTYHTGAGSEQVVKGGGRFRPDMEVDLALELFDAHPADERPLFVVLSWGPPHDPHTPPPRFLPEGKLRLPPNVLTPAAKRYAREQLPGYYGLVSAIDHSFGRLLDGLDERGLAEDTLVIYTSDHGNQLGSHDLVGKEMPHDASTRVPLLARWPGRLAPGATLDVPSGAIDLLPTLAGLTGIDDPGARHGRDLSGLWTGAVGGPGAVGAADAGHDGSASAGADTDGVGRAPVPRAVDAPEYALLAGYETNVVAWPGWRGLRSTERLFAARPDGPWLLYDTAADPHELVNLVDQRPDEVAALAERLRAELAAVGDPWPAA